MITEADPSASGEEPSVTIVDSAWAEARAGLARVTDDDARTLLASAMDQVESGWEAMRGLQRIAEQHPRRERGPDGFGSLLTFAEAEVLEVFRELASDLAEWVRKWPGDDLSPHNDVEARLSEFGRYVTVLVRATAAALDLPEAFGSAVRQVGHLVPGGEWFGQLSTSFASILDVAGGLMNVEAARDAMHALVRELPESVRQHAGGLLVADLEAAYAKVGGPPSWIRMLKAYFDGPNGRGVSPELPAEDDDD